MRRRMKLALVAGVVAAMAVPAAPARASICQSDPEAICTAYYLAASVICKVTKGQSCMT
jgi:hypothetical protein